MRKSKQFDSMPVISLEEGRQLGLIKGLVINSGAKKIAALIVEQKGLFGDQKFISFSKIRSVGEDVITVTHGTTAQKADNLPEIISLVKEKQKIIGARIVTEGGTMLGVVDDYYVDLTSGKLVGLEFSGSYISGLIGGVAYLDIEYVLTIGKEMIICSDEALDKVVKLDGGLQDRLRGVRESTSQFWESTVLKSKKLSGNVNKSWAKFKRPKDGQETQAKTEDTAPESDEKPDEEHRL